METEPEEVISVKSGSPMEPVKGKHSYEWSEPESKMMQYQLKNIIENAEELIQMIEGVNEIEDWVQAKVTLADDYISTLRDYMKHRD
jgi:serine protease inhibitor